MARFGEYLDHRPRDAPFALDRLITVGIGADRERSDLVAPLGEFDAEQLRRIGLGEKLAFEVEPRRQVVKGVARAREAIDAAMFAAAIRSEEHTSELQSLMRNSYAVFCLKNKNNI